jgi:NADPH:quinone reductase-like Zn-dependent oxidoreductase
MGASMKAIVCTQYGPPDLLQFKEIAKPLPADNEALVKICAASANPLDWRIMRGDPFFVRLAFGLRKPKIEVLGSDFAGRVEAVGKDVTEFQPGDEVFGAKGFVGGAFAEYVCAREEDLVKKPVHVSFEQAAAVPIAALTALQGLRDKGHIRPGQKVAIDGASGGVGTFAIQIAKSFGAEVTAVCSTNKTDTARSIGANHVLDYTQQNFTRNGQQYDLILAANARHSIFAYRRALSPDGICVKAGGEPNFQGILQDLLLAPLLSLGGRKKTCGFIAKGCKGDMVVLKDLLDAGKIVPVIDRRYPLSETAEALRYLEEGHAQGKVVITVEH